MSRRHQVTFNRKTENLGKAIKTIASTDFQLRMRNTLTSDLQRNEVIIDDDLVGVSRSKALGARAARRSTPQLALAITTSERLRIVIVDGEDILESELRDVKISHDEDGMITLMFRPRGKKPEPITLVFATPRAAVAKFLRERCGEGGGGGRSRQGLVQRLRPG